MTFSPQAPVLFDELAEQLADRDVHPSELHGYLCGLLSAASRMGVQQWLQQVADQIGEKNLDDATGQLLSKLFVYTQSELESGALSVTMLLPDDDESLSARTSALGIWCQSFLSGFGQGLGQRKVSEMVEEVLKDFAQIALIEASEESEESEHLYMEVYEFVRLAWLNVAAEVASAADNADTKKLH